MENTTIPINAILQTLPYLFINGMAFVGNLLVLIAIYKNPCLRKTTDVFIGTLAIMDLLSACVSQPLAATVLITGRWVAGTTGCMLHGFFGSFLVYMSSQTMLLIALNRYYRVVRPQKYRSFFVTKRVMFLLLCLSTTIAAVVLTPYFGNWAHFKFSGVFPACVLSFKTAQATLNWTMFEFSVFSFAPMLVITICYSKVSKSVKQHNQAFWISFQGGENRISVDEIKITKTLFGLVFAFFACIFSGFVLVVVCRVIAGSVLQAVGITVAYLMAFASAINPILYASTSPVFRREFRLILKCKSSVNQVAPSVSQTSRVNC